MSLQAIPILLILIFQVQTVLVKAGVPMGIWLNAQLPPPHTNYFPANAWDLGQREQANNFKEEALHTKVTLNSSHLFVHLWVSRDVSQGLQEFAQITELMWAQGGKLLCQEVPGTQLLQWHFSFYS